MNEKELELFLKSKEEVNLEEVNLEEVNLEEVTKYPETNINLDKAYIINNSVKQTNLDQLECKLIDFSANNDFNNEIKLYLKKYKINKEEFSRELITYLRSISVFKNHSKIDLMSFNTAIKSSMKFGIIPSSNLNLSYLIPYLDKKSNLYKINLLYSYLGLIHIIKNFTSYKQVICELVYECDDFEVSYKLDGQHIFTHIPNFNNRKNSKITHVWSSLIDNNRIYKANFIGIEEINNIRDKYSSNYQYYIQKLNDPTTNKKDLEKLSKNTFWVSNYEEMVKKTCIKQNIKLIGMRIDEAI